MERRKSCDTLDRGYLQQRQSYGRRLRSCFSAFDETIGSDSERNVGIENFCAVTNQKRGSNGDRLCSLLIR